ncbi:hypothetical protein D3C71_2064940 [compost metagenome]
MVPKQCHLLQPCRLCSVTALKLVGDNGMYLRTPTQEQVVVDHLLQQRLGEAVGLRAL